MNLWDIAGPGARDPRRRGRHHRFAGRARLPRRRRPSASWTPASTRGSSTPSGADQGARGLLGRRPGGNPGGDHRPLLVGYFRRVAERHDPRDDDLLVDPLGVLRDRVGALRTSPAGGWVIPGKVGACAWHVMQRSPTIALTRSSLTGPVTGGAAGRAGRSRPRRHRGAPRRPQGTATRTPPCASG